MYQPQKSSISQDIVEYLLHHAEYCFWFLARYMSLLFGNMLLIFYSVLKWVNSTNCLIWHHSLIPKTLWSALKIAIFNSLPLCRCFWLYLSRFIISWDFCLHTNAVEVIEILFVVLTALKNDIWNVLLTIREAVFLQWEVFKYQTFWVVWGSQRKFLPLPLYWRNISKHGQGNQS